MIRTTSKAFRAGTRRHKRATALARRSAKRYQRKAVETVWHTVAEFAAYCEVSESTVRRWIKAGQYQSRKDGRTTLVGVPTGTKTPR